MLEKQDIVKLEVQNKLFTTNGVGTVVLIEMLGFNGDNFVVRSAKNGYFYNPLKRETGKENSNSMVEGGIIKTEVPFQTVSSVLGLDIGLSYYLLDTKTNFFDSVYPHISPDLARFEKAKKQFFANSKNGLYILPAGTGEEFIHDVFRYADAHKQNWFAKRLAYFADGNALRFGKVR